MGAQGVAQEQVPKLSCTSSVMVGLRLPLTCLVFLLCSLAPIPGLPVQKVYDPEEARMFASLSSVTYCDEVKKVLDWTCTACADSKTALVPGQIKIVDGGTRNATRIIIGKLRDQAGCLMAFRGSDNLENWMRDLQAWQIGPTAFEHCEGCEVHRGFYDIWKNVEPLVLSALEDVGCAAVSLTENVLYVTGHSLGAALTHLSMFTLQEHGFDVKKTYSFEAPRIGNKAFSDTFTKRFTRAFPVFRITHYKDPVVHLPPEALGYTHVQTEVYYNKTGGYKICATVEDKQCADQFWDVPGMVAFHSGDHCSSPLVPNGDICNPGCADLVTIV